MSPKSNDINDVEEAIVPEQPKSPTGRASLSATEKAWDIDGDGQLNEAELALKNIDKSKKGTLSKEQMYNLMEENLKVRGELAKVKKLVILLAVLTVFLACANIALSFASAFLAKDTKTSEGRLVDSSTGVAVKTDSTTMIFKGVEIDASERKLTENAACPENSNSPNCPHNWEITSKLVGFAEDTHSSDGRVVCQKLQEQCENGGSASIRTESNDQFEVCPIRYPVSIRYNPPGIQGPGFIVVKEEGEPATKIYHKPLYRIALYDPSPGEAPECRVSYGGWRGGEIHTLGGTATTEPTVKSLVCSENLSGNACTKEGEECFFQVGNDASCQGGCTCDAGLTWGCFLPGCLDGTNLEVTAQDPLCDTIQDSSQCTVGTDTCTPNNDVSCTCGDHGWACVSV